MTRTSDIPVLTLKNVGDGVTMRIIKCGPMTIGTYHEISFTGIDTAGVTAEVRVPRKSADRQMERLGLDYDSAIGQTLTIKRSHNAQVPNRPFWDVYVADEPIDAPERVRATAPATAAAKASEPASIRHADQSAPTTNGHGEKKSALYEKITDHVLKKIVPKYQAVGIPITQEGTAAIVATLFINACSHH